MLLDLNKEQQKAFNKLKKAYAECNKLKVNLVNQYGTLYAYNGELIIDFGDDEITPAGNPVYYRDIIDKYSGTENFINKVDSGRADDETMWMMGLSDKGLEIYQKNDSE